jgi:hypothetical protein
VLTRNGAESFSYRIVACNGSGRRRTALRPDKGHRRRDDTLETKIFTQNPSSHFFVVGTLLSYTLCVAHSHRIQYTLHNTRIQSECIALFEFFFFCWFFFFSRIIVVLLFYVLFPPVCVCVCVLVRVCWLCVRALAGSETRGKRISPRGLDIKHVLLSRVIGSPKTRVHLSTPTHPRREQTRGMTRRCTIIPNTLYEHNNNITISYDGYIRIDFCRRRCATGSRPVTALQSTAGGLGVLMRPCDGGRVTGYCSVRPLVVLSKRKSPIEKAPPTSLSSLNKTTSCFYILKSIINYGTVIIL